MALSEAAQAPRCSNKNVMLPPLLRLALADTVFRASLSRPCARHLLRGRHVSSVQPLIPSLSVGPRQICKRGPEIKKSCSRQRKDSSPFEREATREKSSFFTVKMSLLSSSVSGWKACVAAFSL